MRTNPKSMFAFDKTIQILQVLLAAIGLIPLLSLWFSFDIFCLLSLEQWAFITLGTTAILFFLIAYIWHLKRKLSTKPDRKNYYFTEDPPIYVNLKDETLHCPKCLFELGNDRSIMGVDYDRGFRCTSCDKYYLSWEDFRGFRANVDAKFFPNRESNYKPSS